MERIERATGWAMSLSPRPMITSSCPRFGKRASYRRRPGADLPAPPLLAPDAQTTGWRPFPLCRTGAAYGRGGRPSGSLACHTVDQPESGLSADASRAAGWPVI